MDREWIYTIGYSETDDPDTGGRLHRCKFDGSERTQLGEAAAAQFNLVDDTIFYIDAEDKSVHKMKTDGSEDASVGDVKAGTIIASGDRIFYTDSPEEGQIWSMGIDGSGAARLSEDKVAAFNVSGDWIYYSHPKDEMMSIEFKKMKRDGSEASRVNEDRPVVINVHEDLLGYLQFDLATFSMSEVFVRTDGSGRKEFIMTPENSMPERPEDDPVNEGEETFMKNEKVSGHGMTVTVDRVFTTNLNPSDAHQKERFFGGANRIDKFLYITFTVTNDGEEPLNMNDRVVIQGKNTEDGGEYILWLNLADVTDRMEEVREKEYLMDTDYEEYLVIQPKETRILQTSGIIMPDGSSPLTLSLFEGYPYASMHIEPDAEIAAVRPAEAMNILNTWLADSDLKVNPLKHRLTGKGTAMQLLYPFEVRDSEDKVVYYVVNGLTREIYTGEQSEDGVIPLDLVQGPPEIP